MNLTIGKQDAKEQAPEFGFQPGRGFHQRRSWKITNPADLPGLLNQLIVGGYRYDVTPESGGAYFTVSAYIESDPEGAGDPTTTPLAEVWERESNVTEKDILESDLALVGSISQTNKEVIRNAINSPSADTSPALTGNAQTIYLLMLNGVKSVRIYSPIVRRTRITANSYTVKVADTNIGKILTTAQMTTLESAPDTVLFNLPTNTIARTDISLRYGWYKKPARVTQQGDGRWQIVQEYEYDYWSTVLYPSAA